ncbi:MAG: hypothetical protein KDC11_13210 [Chitinophagaceae bacterium]|nr:hypothetical protein [Chitinophagaceae bacterium]
MISAIPNVEDTAKVILLSDISAEYYNIQPDSGIAYGKRAVVLADEIKFTRGLAIANNAIGRCYAIQSQYPEALECFNEALVQVRKIYYPYLEAMILTSIGTVYKSRGELYTDPSKDYEVALDYFLQAKAAYEKAGKSTARILFSIGTLYMGQVYKGNYSEEEQIKKVHQALDLYQQAVQEEEQKKRPTKFLASLYGGIGQIYCMLEDYAEGLKQMNNALVIQQQMGNDKGAAFTLNNIGFTYYQATLSNCTSCPDSIRNKKIAFPKVLKYLTRSANIAKNQGNKRLLEHVYSNMSKVYEDMGMYKESKDYFVLQKRYADSLRNISEEKKFAQVEAEYAVKKKTDSLKFANELKDKEIDQRKTERNGTMTILALVGISAVLFINRQNIRRKKLKAEKELADSNLALADSKLKKAQERLDSFTQNLREKNQLIENFSAEIERLQALPCSNELPDTKENLIKLQNSIILTEEQWDNFKDTFEEVHSGFLYRLREKMPDLTPAETRFMALTKLRMTNKEMAGMLGVGDAAVRNYKYRLLKKLDLPSESDINEVVDSI